MTDGYQALRETAALLDVSGRGKVKATGEDRVRFLHAMLTNHVEQLQPGQGCYAFLLNAQGRVLADMDLFCFPSHFLLDTEPETREKLYSLLDNYIIADDVTLEDVTPRLATLAVEGPRAAETLAAAGAPVPEGDHETTAWDGAVVAAVSLTGQPGFRIFVPAGEKESAIQRLAAAGAVEATWQDAHIVRVENGRPRYGEDLTERYIPHETQVFRAVHFNKGCYVGQEIVERVRARGHVNRLLVRLRAAGNEAPEPGTALTAGGKEAGVLTSAAYSPALDAVAALGYVRAVHAKKGERLEAGGLQFEVVDTKPA